MDTTILIGSPQRFEKMEAGHAVSVTFYGQDGGLFLVSEPRDFATF